MVLAFSVVLEVKGENFSHSQSNPKEEPIMKKKMFVTLAALVLAAAALAVPAAAHGHGGWNGDCRQAVSCLDADGTCGRGNYADEDGDGVCDNCGAVHTGPRHHSGNGRHGGRRRCR